MMTELSTMIPKSTAPIDSRLADFALDEEHGDREEQGQRDDQRHDRRADEVAQEDEEDRGDQGHAHDQVVQDVVRRDVDQVGPLVEDADATFPWGAGGVARSPRSFSPTALATSSDFSYFRIRTMPSTTSSSSCHVGSPSFSLRIRPALPSLGRWPISTLATCRT